ncbi:hypothetical protein OE88DRAFT_1736082 [Heliocybe sulcata]|uniref:Uncharacterized protein n=1 Tax=Heliocybe sulcata TaxID=5364 RepID=A0A5C3MYZ7_9AGAM|nr:hypothetical protein OE88DRAFT_1736082 [Heliocybe sulcata]
MKQPRHLARIPSFELLDGISAALDDRTLPIKDTLGKMGALFPKATPVPQAEGQGIAMPSRVAELDVEDVTGIELSSSFMADMIPSRRERDREEAPLPLDGPLHRRIREYRKQRLSQKTSKRQITPYPIPSSLFTSSYLTSPTQSTSTSYHNAKGVFCSTPGQNGRGVNQASDALGTTSQPTVQVDCNIVPKSEGSGGTKPVTGSDA